MKHKNRIVEAAIDNHDSFEMMRGRLREIAEIIEAVDHRCMCVDGPVTPTLKEMTQEEISRIYRLANVAPAASESGKEQT